MDSQPNALHMKASMLAPRTIRVRIDLVQPVGRKHQAADALSRLKITGTYQTPFENYILVLGITASISPELRDECSAYARLRSINRQRGFRTTCSKSYCDIYEIQTLQSL